MVCTNCKTAAALMEAATALFDEREDVWGGVTTDDGPVALATAAAVVRLHARCDGSDQGCGCQHRGTAAARRPALTPGRRRPDTAPVVIHSTSAPYSVSVYAPAVTG